MSTILLTGFKCGRCLYEWVPHRDTKGVPRICPKCKSPYWNKDRKYNLKSHFQSKKQYRAWKFREDGATNAPDPGRSEIG